MSNAAQVKTFTNPLTGPVADRTPLPILEDLTIPTEPSRTTTRLLEALLEHYVLGKRAIRASKTKSGKRKYGTRSVPRFARDEGVATTIVYNAMKFAEQFTQEEFDDLWERCLARDYRFGTHHADVLARITNLAQRQELMECAINERWPYRKLRAKSAEEGVAA